VEGYQNLLIQLISVLRKIKGTAGFNMMGRRPTLRTQLLYCKNSLESALLGVALASAISRLHPSRLLFVGISKKKRVYSNNP
jgi:hypothetical protein